MRTLAQPKIATGWRVIAALRRKIRESSREAVTERSIERFFLRANAWSYWAGILAIAMAIGVIILPALIFSGCVDRQPAPEMRIQERLDGPEMQRYQVLLKKHGLLGRISVVAVHDSGRMYFDRDGQRCELK
jgi:hypothetical protein